MHTTGRDRLREIVLERTELDDDELTETSLFVEEHGVTSMTILEIQADIEMEFDVDIDNDRARRMVNLAAVRAVFAEVRGLVHA